MNKKNALLSVFVICGFLALSGQTFAAAPVNEAGAADLKKLVENVLKPRLDAAKAAGQGLAMGGSPEVTPKGSFYEIKLPDLSIINPQQKMKIGTVILQVTPGTDVNSGAGTWQISGALPTPIALFDQSNNPAGSITIGSQHFAGVWSSTLEVMSDLDAAYKDIRLTVPMSAVPPLSIGSIKASMHPKEDIESADFALEKLSIQGNSKDPSIPPVTLTLDRGSFQGTLHGGKKELSQLSFRKSFEGLKITGMPANIAGLIPNTLNIEINIDKLPAKKIREALTVSPTAAGAQSIPKMLQESGTSLSLQNSYLKSTDLDIAVSGNIVASATAVLGATGKIMLSVKGLEEVLKKMKAESSTPTAQTVYLISGLTVFSMMGQHDKAPDGRTVSTSNFELTPDGKMLLNGADIKEVMAALTAPAAPIAPAPAVPPTVFQSVPVAPSPAPVIPLPQP